METKKSVIIIACTLVVGYFSTIFVWGQAASTPNPIATICYAQSRCLDFFTNPNGYAYETAYLIKDGTKTPIVRNETNDAIIYLIPTVSNQGTKINLSDGSAWDILPAFQSIAAKWSTNHEVAIEKPGRNFSGSSAPSYPTNQYNLIDVKTGNGIVAKLNKNESYFTHQVNKIDAQNSTICLNDNSCWIFKSDLNDFVTRVFKQGDNILLGINKGIESDNYPFILINAMNNITIDVKSSKG